MKSLAINPLIEQHKAAIKALAVRRGIQNVRLFGSMIGNKATANSDVDLLVDVPVGRSALALGGLLMDLQDLLGRRVDLVTEAALHPVIRSQVLKQAIPL